MSLIRLQYVARIFLRAFVVCGGGAGEILYRKARSFPSS
jgi:hypothetical protein